MKKNKMCEDYWNELLDFDKRYPNKSVHKVYKSMLNDLANKIDFIMENSPVAKVTELEVADKIGKIIKREPTLKELYQQKDDQ